jgi:hypothetical protein
MTQVEENGAGGLLDESILQGHMLVLMVVSVAMKWFPDLWHGAFGWRFFPSLFYSQLLFTVGTGNDLYLM